MERKADKTAKAPVLASVEIPESGLDLGGGKVLFEGGLRFEWRRGEHWGVVGPNGCGKTFLVQLLRGDRFHPDADVRLRFRGPAGADPERAVAVVSPESQAR
ncbi:MAG: ATP-binding cassette domain-containing protein, partial [Kiritimatiellae bacterium]|nr:ATP-binding cassette domain-containing protein [Kiritimatiellia bacterium]